MSPRVFVRCWILLAWAAAEARGGSVTLQPSRDNTMIQWSAETPDPNPFLANGQGDIFVGRTNQDGQEEPTISIRRGLLKFDLVDALPEAISITAVTLTMREVMGNNGDLMISLHRALEHWSEGASFYPGGRGAPAQAGDVTWFHHSYDPALPQENRWEQEGGDYSPTTSAATLVSDDFGAGHLYSWSGAGLIADIEAWLSDPSQNFGWLLKGDESLGRTVKRFNSRHPNEDDEDAVAPTLLIEFEPVFAGDYNDDGFVDAADYTVWRDHLNQEITLSNETASPGIVDSGDYEAWRAHFGNVAAGPGGVGAATVPEPTSWAVAMTGGALLMMAGRRTCEAGRGIGESFVCDHRELQHREKVEWAEILSQWLFAGCFAAKSPLSRARRF